MKCTLTLTGRGTRDVQTDVPPDGGFLTRVAANERRIERSIRWDATALAAQEHACSRFFSSPRSLGVA